MPNLRGFFLTILRLTVNKFLITAAFGIKYIFWDFFVSSAYRI